MTCCFYQHLNMFPRLSLNYYRLSPSLAITSGFVHNVHLIRLVPKSIRSCGQILIVHLSRYLDSGNNVFIKNTDFVECLPEKTHVLRVPIQTGDSISFTNQYPLIATINHSGTLQAGHYWAFIKDRFTNNWLKCNDHAVLKVKPHTLNNNTSYVLLYIRN